MNHPVRTWIPLALAGVLSTVAAPATADTLEDLSDAVAGGTVKTNFRYRYEYVDQEGFDEEAGASTLLARLTYTSAPVFDGWQLGLEADYVALIGDENYNSTENGNTEFPVVADPEGFDLNLAFLRYKKDSFTFTGGRQRIAFGDQRFVGGVAWRQNEQTYDSLRFQYGVNEKLKLDYSYIWNVNRIFGPDDGAQPADWHGNSHLLAADYAIAEGHSLRGFAYLLDFENGNGRPNSNNTFGLRYRGKVGAVGLNATVATQSDAGDNPVSFDADYLGLEASYALKPLTPFVGYELLGSDDGNFAFRSPLATLHKFNGFADLFLLTPNSGIEDTYVGVRGKLGGVNLMARYHDFQSDEGSIDYGTEFNVVATWQVTKHFTTQLKFADYSADDFGRDTTKFWFSMIVKL
ncbi:MAG: alginate export family protein [Pseudomonadota bacterium]